MYETISVKRKVFLVFYQNLFNYVNTLVTTYYEF